jgi:hypothetical protein
VACRRNRTHRPQLAPGQRGAKGRWEERRPLVCAAVSAGGAAGPQQRHTRRFDAGSAAPSLPPALGAG